MHSSLEKYILKNAIWMYSFSVFPPLINMILLGLFFFNLTFLKLWSQAWPRIVLEIVINQCIEKQILQGTVSTRSAKNRAGWRCRGEGWGGRGAFQNVIPRKLDVFFLGVTWGSSRSHSFYLTLQPAECLRNLEGGKVGHGTKSQVVSRLSEQNTEGKKRKKTEKKREK